MKRRNTRGFTLVEFVVAIVFVGVVLGPLLVFASRIQDLNNAIGQQSRREAWRTFGDQAVIAGVAPATAPELGAATNPSVPPIAAPQTRELAGAAVPGLARIVALQVVRDASVAEPRMTGAGFQIGAGAAVASRTIPLPPLAPIVMPLPVVTPADGTVIPVSSLTPGVPGAPFSATVEAAAGPGTEVRTVFNQPFAALDAPSAVRKTVNAVDLLNKVSGVAWSEYAGDAGAGDRPVELPDGRVRWMVRTPAGRLQIYEPSAEARFGYTLDLGAPVLVHSSSEYSSGSSIPFDYSGYSEVQRGLTGLAVQFPAAVRAAFGNAWVSQTLGFDCHFGQSAGAFSGDLAPFFQPDALSTWTDSVTVSATPVVPGGAAAQSATWTIVRVKTSLGVPLLSNAADAAGFFAPGSVEFTVPAGADGAPLGRLSFQNGTVLSTSSTLSMTVIP